ncbi:opine metallophore biosynthesis dehydrogenase [Vibrio ostreicida]|uniref:opine metallophore biosynthesis dehydrogenase n=1 Tax=Vibrio ostreicida TaxID=526588 RepID=UPI003B5AE276
MTHQLGRLLIVGAGPAAFQTAALLRPHCSHLGIVSRDSAHWQVRSVRLQQGERVQVEVAKANLSSFAKSTGFDSVYEDLNLVQGRWDTVIIATPAYALVSVLRDLPVESVKKAKEVVLLSSWFGGHQITQGYFAQQELNPNVVVFSNYFAATKFEPREHTLRVVTKAVKKRVYAYVSRSEQGVLSLFQEALDQVDAQVQTLGNGFSVEGRNITLYVHSALFINPFSLDHIFSSSTDKKYMYKLFPEGPITPATMQTLVSLWLDMSSLIQKLGGESFNLLQFLNDDNYPVREESLSRQQIDSFMDCAPIEQEYRLYVRYSAILVDPFSTPDEDGRYFDFSAVPFAKGNLDKEQWPRIPSEDLHALYWLQSLATHFDIEFAAVRRVLSVFERWLSSRELTNPFIEMNQGQSSQSLVWLPSTLGVNNE